MSKQGEKKPLPLDYAPPEANTVSGFRKAFSGILFTASVGLVIIAMFPLSERATATILTTASAFTVCGMVIRFGHTSD